MIIAYGISDSNMFIGIFSVALEQVDILVRLLKAMSAWQQLPDTSMP